MIPRKDIALMKQQPVADIHAALQAGLKREPNGCIVWTGVVKNGYGRVTINRYVAITHRIAYMIYKGDVPEGLTIDHLCMNRLCCNPDHLELVTETVNQARSYKALLDKNAKLSHYQFQAVIDGLVGGYV